MNRHQRRAAKHYEVKAPKPSTIIAVNVVDDREASRFIVPAISGVTLAELAGGRFRERTILALAHRPQNF